jgi:hypothetical protein
MTGKDFEAILFGQQITLFTTFYLNICFIEYLLVKIEGCDKSHSKIGNKHLKFSLLFVFYSFRVYSHIVSGGKIAKHFL